MLLLWAAAIALFINRWGKIRAMEPYNPYVETEPQPATTSIPQSTQVREIVISLTLEKSYSV